MEITIIPHAKVRMKLRGITDTMVRDCLKHPDATGKGYLDRKISYKQFGENYIKVVYENGSPLRIITVMWTTKPQ